MLPNPRCNSGNATLTIEWLRSNTQQAGECWLWLGTRDPKGYGRVRAPNCTRTHRLAYELVFGPIPAGLVIDHKCRTPACCNPEHLEAVTSQENTRRGNSLIYVDGVCPRCGCTKLYRARWGHRCSACLKAYEQKPERVEQRREYEKTRQSTPERRAQHLAASRRYNERKRAEGAV